jgi:hypothetical protein
MKLKSFGCSFIFGTDLHDDSRDKPKATPSNYTWPALLAKQHGLTYTCYARPGAGNLQILERLLNQLADAETALYVIGWTWIDRFDYTGTDIRHDWRTIMPVDTDDLAKTYYRDIHSEYRDKLTTLMNVKLAIDALTSSGNRFIMTYMDDLMFDQRWNTSPAVSELQRYCEPHMTRFDRKSFLEYSKEKGFEISQTLHPLEAAHESAFELIHSYNLV